MSANSQRVAMKDIGLLRSERLEETSCLVSWRPLRCHVWAYGVWRVVHG